MSSLAKVETSQPVQTDNDVVMKYLTFHLGKELYAVNIMAVREIFEYGEITAMPMMPDFICGVVNLRGRAVPVIDLAKRMKQGEAKFSRYACIIIVEMHYGDSAMDIGVIVDAVSRVIDLKNSDIDNTPTFGGNIRTDFVTGLGKIDEQFVILLDMESVLSMNDLEMLSEVDASAGSDESNESEASEIKDEDAV